MKLNCKVLKVIKIDYTQFILLKKKNNNFKLKVL